MTTFMGEVILGPRRVPDSQEFADTEEHRLFGRELTHAVWYGCEMNF